MAGIRRSKAAAEHSSAACVGPSGSADGDAELLRSRQVDIGEAEPTRGSLSIARFRRRGPALETRDDAATSGISSVFNSVRVSFLCRDSRRAEVGPARPARRAVGFTKRRWSSSTACPSRTVRVASSSRRGAVQRDQVVKNQVDVSTGPYSPVCSGDHRRITEVLQGAAIEL